MTPPARALPALALTLLLAAAGPAPSASASPRVAEVCASKATLVETPGGAAVGVVRRGDDVAVLRRGADGRWWRVRARFGTRGWLRVRAICPEDR